MSDNNGHVALRQQLVDAVLADLLGPAAGPDELLDDSVDAPASVEISPVSPDGSASLDRPCVSESATPDVCPPDAPPSPLTWFEDDARVVSPT